MKRSQLNKIINEEIRNVLKEGNAPASSEVLSMLAHPDLKKAMNQLSDQMSPDEYSEIYKLYTDLYLKVKEYEGGSITESMAYGEKEAGEEIFNNPKIEAALKKIKGYDSIASGKPGDMYIYFRQQQSAIAGAKLLDKLVPGPDYENSIVQDSGMWVIEIES